MSKPLINCQSPLKDPQKRENPLKPMKIYEIPLKPSKIPKKTSKTLKKKLTKLSNNKKSTP